MKNKDTSYKDDKAFLRALAEKYHTHKTSPLERKLWAIFALTAFMFGIQLNLHSNYPEKPVPYSHYKYQQPVSLDFYEPLPDLIIKETTETPHKPRSSFL